MPLTVPKPHASWRFPSSVDAEKGEFSPTRAELGSGYSWGWLAALAVPRLEDTALQTLKVILSHDLLPSVCLHGPPTLRPHVNLIMFAKTLFPNEVAFAGPWG